MIVAWGGNEWLFFPTRIWVLRARRPRYFYFQTLGM